MSHDSTTPIVQAVALEPRRALDPNVVVVSLCLVLQLGGTVRFLWLLAAVLVLEGRLNPFALLRRVIPVARAAGNWMSQCLAAPPAVVQPRPELPLWAQALAEFLDEVLPLD